MEEKQTLEQLKTELDDFKPSDDPQADATRLAGYMKDMLGFIKEDRDKAAEAKNRQSRSGLMARTQATNTLRSMI